MADRDKQAVYNGERLVQRMLDQANAEDGNRLVMLHGSTLALPVEYRFASVEAIQAYVDRVLSHPEIVEAFAPRPLRVRKRKGDLHAHYEAYSAEGGPAIAIPMDLGSWAAREIVVLHEIAHHIARGDHHGKTFRDVMARLASAVMAPEVGLALRLVWHDYGLAA